jgi:hypothetical protein
LNAGSGTGKKPRENSLERAAAEVLAIPLDDWNFDALRVDIAALQIKSGLSNMSMAPPV